MLAADKAALETSLKKRAIDIQEKELHFFVENNHSIGEQSSLLAGFSFAALTMTGFTGLEGESRKFKMGYYSMAVLSMTCHLITILMTTLSNVYGPGLALRGPAGSMKTAVDGMKVEQRWILRFFGIGVLFFHIAAIMFAWVAFQSYLVIVVVSVVLAAFVVLFFTSSMRINKKFEIPDDKLVSGGYSVEDNLYGEDAAQRISLVRRTRTAYQQ